VQIDLDLGGRPDGDVTGFAEGTGGLLAVGYVEGNVPNAAVWLSGPRGSGTATQDANRPNPPA